MTSLKFQTMYFLYLQKKYDKNIFYELLDNREIVMVYDRDCLNVKIIVSDISENLYHYYHQLIRYIFI